MIRERQQRCNASLVIVALCSAFAFHSYQEYYDQNYGTIEAGYLVLSGRRAGGGCQSRVGSRGVEEEDTYRSYSRGHQYCTVC
jgi:hypothetical protein